MHIRRLTGCILIIALLLGCLAALLAYRAEALDYSVIETKLSTWQYYFCRTIMSVALKDSYDAHVRTGKNIFPSITCGQACFEGGICGAPISVIGKGHFAVRAYSYFTGKVYDDKELVTYNSYLDAVNIKGRTYVDSVGMWRAYDTWEECIADHTDMLLTQDKYSDFVSASNYEEAAQAYQDSKYKGAESNYKENLLKRVEGYGFVQLDSVKEDRHGIFGLIMSDANILLDSGETRQLVAASYPATAYDCTPEIVWASSNTDVATVDQSGNVTAVSTGYALITADYHGKEACCVVCVDCNGYVMYGNYSLYSQPDSDSNSLGKLLKGQPIHLESADPILSDDGLKYYHVTARVSNGKLLTGYVSASRVYVLQESRASVTVPFSRLDLEPGEEETVALTVHAEEMREKEIVWTSSNTDVAAVDQAGRVSAVSKGACVIYIYADGVCALTFPVYVGSPVLPVLETVRANDLRIRPEQDKTDNEYGTIRVGTYAQLLSVPLKGWYRILTRVDGRIHDGFVKNSYFKEADDPPDDPLQTRPRQDDDPSGDTSSGSVDPTEPRIVTITYHTGEVIADDWLNVRDAPSASANRIAKLPSKTRLTILETVETPLESVFKTWYRISFEHEGETLEGYAATDYIEIVSSVEVEVPDEPVNTDRYVMDETYLRNISPRTAVDVLTAELEREVEVSRNGVPLSGSDILSTGDSVRFFIGRIPVYTLTAVIKGDVDMNGSVSASDYLKVKRHVLGTYTLTGPAMLAGCLSGTDSISASDYVKIKRAVLGTYDLS